MRVDKYLTGDSPYSGRCFGWEDDGRRERRGDQVRCVNGVAFEGLQWLATAGSISWP
jgi:hypothetical protein